MQRRRSLLALALIGALGLAIRPAYAAPATPFRDVPQGSWAAAAVADLSRAGLITGYPDGTFRPGAPVTGAAVVALTDRLVFGADSPPPPGQPWYAGDMSTAVAHGWIIPSFPPNAPVNRETAFAVLGAAFVGLGDQPLPDWTDARDIRSWARPGVAAAAAAGLVEGFPDGRLSPLAPITRAQAAVLFARAQEQLFVQGQQRFRVAARLRLRASAYSSSEPGMGSTTATGTPVHVGEMAVDPSTIPLGSYVWVSGYRTPYLPAGGILERAEDTGGSIRGHRIDLYMSCPAAGYDGFGLQRVRALVLEPLP